MYPPPLCHCAGAVFSQHSYQLSAMRVRMATLSTGTLRPHPLRQRLDKPPAAGISFALVCSKCPSIWYFASQAEALRARSQHEDPTTLFRYESVPTRALPSGHMLREHVWLEILEICSDTPANEPGLS